MTSFWEGQRVILIKPFRCQGDDLPTDERIDKELRELYAGKPIAGTVVHAGVDDFVHVDFDYKGLNYSQSLFVDEDCLAPEEPSDEEIKAAFGIEGI